MTKHRIGGVVHKLVPQSYAIAIGDDGQHYLVLPSALSVPEQFRMPRAETEVYFADLAIGLRVKFFPFKHPRGLRANIVTVVAPSDVAVADG